LGGGGDSTDALPFQAHPLEELAHLRRLATQAGQPLDALGGLGDGTRGPASELFPDRVAMGGQVRDGAGDVPASQPAESAAAEGSDVALDGSPPEFGDLGGLLARHATV
jgi:hypothetical protein